MIHIDLFSGIGGFAYAVDQVWDGAEHIFCEIDPFCQQVLKKHWKGSVIYGDIREFIADADSRGQAQQEQQEAGHKQLDRIDLLTGGFPCQPFSQAGKRKGTDDDRHLWPKMLRVIQLTKPTWVIVENVRGLLTIEGGMVFEQVCLDLEAEGYDVQPLVIPAVAVNAPHRRDRVWFVAHSKFGGFDGGGDKGAVGEIQKRGQDVFSQVEESSRSDASDTGNERLEGRSEQGQRLPGQQNRNGCDKGRDWEKNWLEVATELCGVDDGLPVELDGFKLSKARHRVERLKALGNSIVPQVAIEIMRGISTAV